MSLPLDFESDVRSILTKYSTKTLFNALHGLTSYWKLGARKYEHDSKEWNSGTWLHRVGTAKHIQKYADKAVDGSEYKKMLQGKRLIIDAQKQLRQRNDYKNIVLECCYYNLAVAPILFLDTFKYTEYYLGRIDVDKVYQYTRENSEVKFLTMNQLQEVALQYADPKASPIKFKRINSFTEDLHEPDLGIL